MKFEDLSERDRNIYLIYSTLDGIHRNCDQLTSANYMHHKGEIKYAVCRLKTYLQKLGINNIDKIIEEEE